MRLNEIVERFGASNLARATGLHRSTVSHLVAGRISMGLSRARRIAKATGTTLSFDGDWKFTGRAKLADSGRRARG